LPTFTPATSSGYPEKQAPYPHDVDAAKRLTDEAGEWPDGRTLIVATPAPFEAVARMVASDIEAGLSIDIKVTVIPTGQILASSRVVIEKRITPPWDILIYGWFDLSSEASPPEGRREFYGADGAFRAGPVNSAFDKLFAETANQLDGQKQTAVAECIDQYLQD